MPSTGGPPLRFTFYGLMSLGLTLLMVYFGGALLLSSITSPASEDWLVDGRHVILTPSRYQPGSVTHFDFKAMNPPRNGGFFLIRGDDDFAAVFDRPGCLLEYRPARSDLYNPCTRRSYPVRAILEGTAEGPDLRLLPLAWDDGRLRIDVSSALSAP